MIFFSLYSTTPSNLRSAIKYRVRVEIVAHKRPTEKGHPLGKKANEDIQAALQRLLKDTRANKGLDEFVAV